MNNAAMSDYGFGQKEIISSHGGTVENWNPSRQGRDWKVVQS